MSRLIKIAFGSVPKDGGTFTFYRNIRPALLDLGIELLCVTIGKRESEVMESSYIDDGCVLLAEYTNSVKKQAIVFAEWCDQEKVDIVMAINSVAILSALPYLQKMIRVVSRCASGRDEGYRITMSGSERLMRIIALTPRLQKDLIKNYKADSALVELIPNGLDIESFNDAVKAVKGQSTVLQLGFLGRLHEQKGILHLPKILDSMQERGVKFYLRIAGKGIHRKILEQKLLSFIDSGCVEFIGAIDKDEVPGFLAEIDVYLFTSYFEGCPNTLLEAMMAGCVPVSFLIDDTTDFIIKHGETGFIVPMSDCTAFAEYVDALARNRELLRDMSEAVAKDARKRFGSKAAAIQYARVFKEVMVSPLPEYQPLSWSKFKVDSVYRRDWSVKNVIRVLQRKMKMVRMNHG